MCIILSLPFFPTCRTQNRTLIKLRRRIYTDAYYCHHHLLSGAISLSPNGEKPAQAPCCRHQQWRTQDTHQPPTAEPGESDDRGRHIDLQSVTSRHTFSTFSQVWPMISPCNFGTAYYHKPRSQSIYSGNPMLHRQCQYMPT